MNYEDKMYHFLTLYQETEHICLLTLRKSENNIIK